MVCLEEMLLFNNWWLIDRFSVPAINGCFSFFLYAWKNSNAKAHGEHSYVLSDCTQCMARS